MNSVNHLLKSFRLVSVFVKQQCTRNLISYRSEILLIPSTHSHVNVRTMAQKSITSFFKVTPKKCGEDTKERLDEKKSPTDSTDSEALANTDEPVHTAKRSSKRLRSESGEDKSPNSSQKISSPVSIGKKKSKRQRIESSDSEPESPSKQTMYSSRETKENEPVLRSDNDSIKTYASPKSKKLKKKEASHFAEEISKMEENGKYSPSDDEVKEEKSSPRGNINLDEKEKNIKRKSLSKNDIEESSSPEGKRSKSRESSTSPSPTKKGIKKEKSTPIKRNPFEVMKTKSAVAKGKDMNNKVEETDNGTELVAEVDYDPSKSKYHPIRDACWAEERPVPYLALARTLEAIEATSARLKTVEILSNYLRSVIVLTPDDLLPSVYLCLNQLAPAYHSVELGVAETYLMKAVGGCTGRSVAQMRAAARRCGDLGRAAEAARAAQRTVCRAAPLTVRGVLAALRDVARAAGPASVAAKIAKIRALYVACRHSEARFLVRSLEGKLRVGLAEQSLLQALALAAARSPAAGPHAGSLDVAAELSPDAFKATVDRYALTIKTTYCECPNYELLVPVLLRHGVPALPDHCRLAPGVPLKPMLAHPTRGVHEVFDRFEGSQFTCEYKYDGERAQIHVPGEHAPDFARAAIFSRNQEDNTSKYPDVLSRLPALLKETVTSCVLDCEAVAYDTVNRKILPFQVLSTRKRKGARAAEIKVQVCVFVFDLLYLNGRALVREPLAERRRLLHDHFAEQEGTWQFARSRDCSATEEVQQFLEEAVRDSCEGLMVKTLLGDNARYDIARRSHNWLKLKKDYLEGVGDTIDAVVIGGYRGRGKRAGLFGGFLLACWDPTTEQYQSLCKIGTGFSDEDLRTLGGALQRHVIEAPPNYYSFDGAHAPDEWFAAACVWEVRCADLSLSPAHRAAVGLLHPDRGVSLRFPRFMRERADKTGERATTAQQLADMYLAQEQVRGQPARLDHLDHFY